MGLVCAPIPIGIGADTNSRVSPYVARVLSAAGKVWVGRYVSLPGNSPVNDISIYELETITGAGLSASLIQHVRSGHWNPAEHSGHDDGAHAAAHALSVGYPQGCHLYLDLESMSGTAEDAIVFANQWSAAVKDSGYRAGLYSGFDVTLTPGQLFHDLEFDSYWTAPGPWSVAIRGSAIKQGLTLSVAGVEFDVDTISKDLLQSLPFACAAD
jgi:glycoside hydrolase-like protein